MNSILFRSITILLLLIAGCRPAEEVAPSAPTAPTTTQAAKPGDSSDPSDPPDSGNSPDSVNSPDPVDSSDASRPSDSSDPPGVIVYSTGEDLDWPSIPPPLLEISFDLPEVPEHILGPFSADDIPPKE